MEFIARRQKRYCSVRDSIKVRISPGHEINCPSRLKEGPKLWVHNLPPSWIRSKVNVHWLINYCQCNCNCWNFDLLVFLLSLFLDVSNNFFIMILHLFIFPGSNSSFVPRVPFRDINLFRNINNILRTSKSIFLGVFNANFLQLLQTKIM